MKTDGRCFFFSEEAHITSAPVFIRRRSTKAANRGGRALKGLRARQGGAGAERKSMPDLTTTIPKNADAHKASRAVNEESKKVKKHRCRRRDFALIKKASFFSFNFFEHAQNQDVKIPDRYSILLLMICL